jgi:signal transduction histidine kinase
MLSLIGFGGGIMNFLPAFNINIFPYGNFIIIIPSFIVTYIIFKHQLFDIAVVIKKSFIYSILITIISLTYLIIVVSLERLSQGVVGYRSIYISIFTAFGFGLVLVPLHKKIQHCVDNIFFKGSQEEIARQNELLREQVAQAERLKTVATLASGIAHEIKNPLTAMKTFTEHLPQKMDDKEFLSKFSRIVGHEVDRIDNLVHQLLDFAKPSPLTLAKINLNELLCDTLDLLSSHFVKCRIQLIRNFECSKNFSFVLADFNKLRQAFLNILLNAIEAMPDGGTLTVQLAIHDSRITIYVIDTGPGIPAKDLKHIFDPFYTTKDHGTGLGLSITQRIIEEHSGKIFIESEAGKGTMVRIEMPSAEPEGLNPKP